MMRRSRISVKPNFRPGSRMGTEGEHVSQGVKEAGVTLPAIEAKEVARPAATQQQNIGLTEPSKDVGIKDAAEVFSNTNQNDGAPSSGATTSSTAPHRRMRISAAPKLVAPKITSTPRARPSASFPSSAPSSQSKEVQVKIHDSASEAQVSSPVISNDVPESGTPRKSTSPTNLPTQSLSPCVPSTSGLRKSPVRGKKSVEDSPPSPQPGQIPQQPPQEPEPPERPCSTDMPSVCINPLHFDKSSSSETTEKSSDTDRIIRALKLKELMKIERKKDIQMGKRKVGHKEFTGLDRSKMTMRDLIYYLPSTSPMRSSVVQEENQEETIIPPSPKQQIKTAEKDDDDEEEAESENEEMLVPKVRVAEDGSIILDEESLTVRVQRTSNTKLVENSMFERGSTTTYASFRTLKHVKTWSVRETDLFFLAINMVGTDFSLIGQLLTHRTRAEIKSKFKKEEKVNPWRIDKALRNTRPYDKEFFSYLREKILAKDKDKRKSVKLILPKTRKPRKSKGNKASEHSVSGDDDVFHMDNQNNLEHDGDLGVEKENEDLSNVKETKSSVPAKKKCKRARAVSEDKDSSTTDQVKRKKQRKSAKNTKRDAKDDTEAKNELIAPGDTINLNKEDELNKRNTSALKKRSKRSNNGGDKENEKEVKRTKRKQLKKSCKVISDNEESNGEHEASSIMDEDGSTTKKKRKRAEKSDLNEDETTKRKKNTKRKKALKSTVEEDDTAEEGEGALEDLQEAKKLNAPVTAEVVDKGPSQTSRRSKKVLPNLATRRNKKSCEPEAFPDVEGESQDANNPESTLTAADSPLPDERLQMQAVVVLEKTPPRQQNLLSPSKVKCKTDELEPSGSSPASSYSSESSCAQQTRIQRAGKVKRDLSNSGKKGQGMLDQDETDLVSPVVLLERLTQEPEYEADELSLNENMTDLSCLRDLHSQMFQRRPMVVLSREEVDRILDASDQSADEEPSVSPLDLSLNTELSFPLRCSKILDDDDDDDDDDETEVDCGFEEHEERTNEMATSKERNCEKLVQAESVSGEPAISNLKDISTSLKPEVCSQPKVPLSNITPSSPIKEGEPEVQPMTCKDVTTVATVVEGSPTLDIQDNLDSVCTNPDAPPPQETVTTKTAMLGTSLGVSDIMEKSVSSIPPIVVKESALAFSEITEGSKLTLTESVSESQRSQEPTPEFHAGLRRSLEGSLHTLESLQGSSESKEDTQKSANSEINTSTQEVKVDSQEEVFASSSASVAFEHGIKLTRRSKFLKPKPNLSQKSRPTTLQNQRRDPKTHSTQKPTSSETEVSKETLLYSPANDQHGALEDLRIQNRIAEETSLSKAFDQLESELTKDVGDGSTAVQDKKAITTPAVIDDEPPMASQSSSRTCDVDRITPCSSLTSPQPLQPGESTGTEERIISSEDVCAPAEILHLNDDGHNDEEPTFILTLYEIPVTQSQLTSSSKDYEMTSDLATVETQAFLGFSDQAHVLPCTSESSRIDSSLVEGSGTENNLGVISEDLLENDKEEIMAQATSQVISSSHAKSVDCDASSLEMYIPPNDPDLGCEMGSEFSPLDLALAPSAISVSNCIKQSPQDSDDSKQHKSVSHILLGGGDVPVSEETGDDSNKNRTMTVESKLQSKDTFSANVTEDLAANVSEQASSHEPVLLYTKDKQSDDCANQETDAPHTDRESVRKNGSELAPLEDLAFRTQSTFSGFNITKSVTTLPQDSEDKDQYDGVSHTVLADIFVPVSEEMGDSSSKEASSASVTDNLAENVKEKISELMTAPEPILLDTKDEEERENFADMETGILHLDPNSECKEGSKISPLEDSLSRNQNKPFGFCVSKSIETLPQNPEDTAQFGHVSDMLLTDVFVPVSEETGDDSNKDRTQVIEEKSHSKEPSIVSVPQRQNTPYEERRKDSTKESKDSPGSSEEQKAPPRRRARQIKPQPKLVKRTLVKDDASKTDKLMMELSPPSSSSVFLPARHEENLAGISNTTDEKPVGTMSSIKGNQTCVDGGKKDVPKSIKDESLKMSQDDLGITESKPISTLLHKSEDFKLEEERSENVTGETAVKDDMESSAEDKEFSIPTNVQSCCEDMVYGSSAVNSEETVAGTQGVCHMVLPDVLVLVSDEMEDGLCEEPLESLSKNSSTHFQKELKTEDVSQAFVEKSAQDQWALVDIKTPVRERGKQEVKTTFTETDLIVSQPTSSQATTPSSQLNTLPQNENMVLLEEKLKRRHHIMPCTVRLSSLDTAGQSMSSPRLEGRKGNDQRSLSTCHASVTNLSEELNTPSLFEKKKLQEAESEETSSKRSKGKKNESSPDTTRGHLKPVQTLGRTQQLTITDWLKKKSSATKQEGEKEPETSSHVQSCLKVKGMHEAVVEKTKDSEEPEGSHLVPAMEENEEVKMSSEVVKESNDDPSVSQVKKSPPRRRAKLQVKPKLLKRACTSECDTSTPDPPQPTLFTSSTRQHARAAKEKEESKNEQLVNELPNTSSLEENSEKKTSLTRGPQSPISQDTWPRVVLPRVKLWTTEAGVSSASSTPTSSPARVSQSVSPPQLKKSTTQSSSPTDSENSDDDPSRVSQFFLSDIFTEVEEAE